METVVWTFTTCLPGSGLRVLLLGMCTYHSLLTDAKSGLRGISLRQGGTSRIESPALLSGWNVSQRTQVHQGYVPGYPLVAMVLRVMGGYSTRDQGGSWRESTLDRAWGEQFLALLDSGLSETIIMELGE